MDRISKIAVFLVILFIACTIASGRLMRAIREGDRMDIVLPILALIVLIPALAWSVGAILLELLS